MGIVGFLGAMIAVNFAVFAPEIIPIVSSSAYLGSFANIASRGSDQILPFLGIVLFLSFVKQVYNYTFVALDVQNKLFTINLVGVILGCIVGVYLIPRYGLAGGVATQLLIELLFTGGAIFVGRRDQLTPIFPRKQFALLGGALCGFLLLAQGLGHFDWHFHLNGIFARLPLDFFLWTALINALLIALAYRPLKRLAQGLTQESPHPQTK